MNTKSPILSAGLAWIVAVGCSGADEFNAVGSVAGAGGQSASGGAMATGGSASASTGGSAIVGGSATGGSATGGLAAGGNATGGAATGGNATGGGVTGGNMTGGNATGGAATGGNATGGAATGGAATGGSATGGRSNTCGDAAVMERFTACNVAADAQSCVNLGGTWTQRPPAGPSMFCLCPSGDGGCPCTKRSDCVVDCIAPLPMSSVCTEITSWQCADAPQLNCWCSLEDSGNAVPFCS